MNARDLRPLPSACARGDDAVLFFDPSASFGSLFDEGMHRFDTAHDLARVLSCTEPKNPGTDDAMPVVAGVFEMLTGDAKALLYAMHDAHHRERIEQGERVGEAFARVQIELNQERARRAKKRAGKASAPAPLGSLTDLAAMMLRIEASDARRELAAKANRGTKAKRGVK